MAAAATCADACRVATTKGRSSLTANDTTDWERNYVDAVNRFLYGNGDLLEEHSDTDSENFSCADSEDAGDFLPVRTDSTLKPATPLEGNSGHSTGTSPSSPRFVELSTLESGLAQRPESNQGWSDSEPSSNAPPWSQSPDPCLQRGWRLVKALATSKLPQMVENNLPGFLHIIAEAVLDCYAAGKLPTVAAIQAYMLDWCIPEEAQQSVLPLVACNPYRFVVWFPEDAKISVLLADRLHQSVNEMVADYGGHSNSFLGAHTTAFLEMLTERVFQTVCARLVIPGAAPAPMHIDVEQAGSASSLAQTKRGEPQQGKEAHTRVHHEKQPLSLAEGLPVTPAAGAGTTTGHTGEQATVSTTMSPAYLADKLVTEGVTTLMVRNMPRSVSQTDFMEALVQTGFKGDFDFFYLPSIFDTGCNKGYAFINFSSAKAMSRFVRIWHNSKRFVSSADEFPLTVCKAAVQGLEQNMKRWDGMRMRRVRNPALRPWVAVKSE